MAQKSSTAKKIGLADLAHYVGDSDHMQISPEHLVSDVFTNARRMKLDAVEPVNIRVQANAQQQAIPSICLRLTSTAT